MKKMLCIFLLATAVGFAQQTSETQVLDTVLLDTKTPIARKNSGKVITVISSNDLQRSAGKSVAEIINTVSGIEINGSRSNDGQNLGYFVRGGRNRQVVIMVDGVQLNDPSQIANDYDLRLVPATSIESIEIIKGASSVLYGSGAATAVISITTKKASKEPIRASFTIITGSNAASENEDSNYDFETFSSQTTINGSLGKFFYNATFGNRYTDGLSAVAAPEDEALFEADVFNRYDGRIQLGYHFSENIKISQFFSFDKFKAGFDDFGFVDTQNQSISKQLKTGGNFEWKFAKGKYVFNDSYTWIEREIASGFPSKFDAKSYTLDNYLSYNVMEEVTALVGLNINLSSFNSFTIPFGETDFAEAINEDIANFDIIDPYINATYISKFGFQVTAGARLNIHIVYNTHLVYNVNPSYVFNWNSNNLKVLASYGTAYITPSLFQLYDPLYGNESLTPEENATLESGLEFFTKGFRVSALYFSRDEANFVDFVSVDPDNFVFQYQNIGSSFTASGVEVELYKRIGDKLAISANYTNTKADERFALRIPEHKINGSINYRLGAISTIGLDFQYNSDRDDTFFNAETFENESITLDNYSLVDLNFSTQWTKNVRVFANITNLFNTEYEELYRFQTRGRNLRVGVTLDF